MFNVFKYVLKNNRTTLVFYAIIMMVGVQSFINIGRQEYPSFTIRTAVVITQYPGRSAVQVEEEVTEPLEQAIRKISEIKNIKSTSKAGVSIINVNIRDEFYDLQPIWQNMRNKVGDVRLPDGAQIPYINDEFGDVFPYLYALSGDGYTDREIITYAENIRDQLLTVDGVSKVNFHGLQEERIYVDFSNSKLAANGLTPQAIAQSLQEQNAVSNSGNVLVGNERLTVVTKGEYESIEELKETTLVGNDGVILRLSDLASITRSSAEPASKFAHYNGQRVVCIAVSMMDGNNVSEIGENVAQKIQEIEKALPLGIKIQSSFFQPRYVDQSVRDFLVNLAQAFTFVAVVMLIFAGWRISAIVALLVPSAVLFSFAMMPSFDIELEMMSIAALIIALGLLVDNAVVVSEQILVRMGQGQDRRDACIGAVQNLIIPLLAASATTIAAFSPIALASGGTSEFTYSLFAVVSMTLLSSWVLSITIIPLFCFYFLKPLKKDTFVGEVLDKLYAPYERFLRFAVSKRWAVPAVVLLLTIVAGWGFKFIPNIFFPPSDRGQCIVDFSLPLGTDISETEQQISMLEQWLLNDKKNQVESVSSWIGEGGPRWYLSLSVEQANPNYGLLSVLTRTDNPEDVKKLVDEINKYSAQHFPDARVSAKTLEVGPAVGDPIQLKLFGRDLEEMYRIRDQIITEMKQVSGLCAIYDDWGAWTKQISINPNLAQAQRLGLTSSSIASAINTQYKGLGATKYRDGDKSIPVLLRSDKDYRSSPERIKEMPIYGSVGGYVPLSQVADVSLDILPGSILREDTLRVMTIKARVQGRYASDALAEIRPRIQKLLDADEWPSDYEISFAGESEESAEAQGSIGAAMPVALSILAIILIAQFNSVRRFGIIMLTIPPMMIGVTAGLLITGSTFGFMTMLGIIALMGIIVNNAILIIDETDTQISGGLDVIDGIIEASKSRLRPILMTTVTTIIGLLPLAISGGDMWNSMAYAMMFGLGFATVLTLVLCPVLYSLLLHKK